RDARAEYENCHIPNAVFFDIDEVSDSDSPYPHMLPPLEKFVSRMRKLGLGDGSRIIIYDNSDYHSAARLWWMLHIFGHHDCAVLDGGLQKWLAEGRAVEDLPPPPRDRHFTARFDQTKVRDIEQVKAMVNASTGQIIDARSAPRFSGAEAEPRPNMRSGHIPDSKNIHYAALYEDDGTMKNPGQLKDIFMSAGVDLNAPITTTCGSGVTACALALALDQLGHQDVSVYDGSWSEWGALKDTPVETE
ncbi:MAG: 3-mercaptopyruvate sulfurtransferase, partial [Sphingomonadales bacterium]